MRKAIIAGNWKMNKSLSEAKEFVVALKGKVPAAKIVDAVIGGPNIFTQKLVEWTADSPLKVAAQNSHYEDSGAFTGETSPKALAEFGTDYVILGHSERRELFGETDEEINKKVQAVLKHQMIPIICVGESLEKREAGVTDAWVADQIKAALEGVTPSEVKKVVIAYEPLWAIGTGKTASSKQANDTIKAARQSLTQLYDQETAQAIRFQYGGSVSPANIDDFLAQTEIDGALVGGASLEVDSFLKILEAARK